MLGSQTEYRLCTRADDNRVEFIKIIVYYYADV